MDTAVRLWPISWWQFLVLTSTCTSWLCKCCLKRCNISCISLLTCKETSVSFSCVSAKMKGNVHTKYTQCTHNVHTMYTQCRHNIRTKYTQFTHKIHTMYTKCTHNVHKMYTQCTQNVHTMYTQRTHNVHTIYTQPTHNVLLRPWRNLHYELPAYRVTDSFHRHANHDASCNRLITIATVQPCIKYCKSVHF